MIIGVIADGLKKPVRRAAKTLDKAAEAFMDKVMAEILRKKAVRLFTFLNPVKTDNIV